MERKERRGRGKREEGVEGGGGGARRRKEEEGGGREEGRNEVQHMENMNQSPQLLVVKSLPQMQSAPLPQPSFSAPPAVSPSWQYHHESPSHDLRNISDGPLHAACCV